MLHSVAFFLILYLWPDDGRLGLKNVVT